MHTLYKKGGEDGKGKGNSKKLKDIFGDGSTITSKIFEQTQKKQRELSSDSTRLHRGACGKMCVHVNLCVRVLGFHFGWR